MKLKDLQIASVVRDSKSPLLFLVAAQNHPGYGGGTTLYAQKIVELGCLDGAEPEKEHIGVMIQDHFYGCNDYGLSNVHQWLNSDQSDWFSPSHDKDTPPAGPYTRYNEVPYDTRPGFLSQFSDTFKQALIQVDVPYLKKTGKDVGIMTSVPGKVFLPSRTEIGRGDEHGYQEGTLFPLAYDMSVYRTTMTEELLAKYGREINPERSTAHYDAPQIYDPKYGWWYWLRTANMGYSFLNRVASPYGALSYTYSNNDSVGIRPVLNLDGELEVVSNGKFNEIFTIL